MTTNLEEPIVAPSGGPGSDRLVIPTRYRTAYPFLVVGSVSIVAGGLVAAVSRPTDFDHGPWLAAFLVLVAGVAQIALGVGQAWLAGGVPTPRTRRLELILWNLSVLTTVAGTLLGTPALTAVGAAALVAALILFLLAVRTVAETAPRWAVVTYRGLVAVVLISTPVGQVLAWTGAS